MARLGKLIKGTRYQIGRFAGAWYVVNLDKMKFVYGPFIRESTAIARLEKLAGRINPRTPPFGSVHDKPILYKGYWILHTLTRKIYIEKDGYLIGWAKSIDDAKKTIDLLSTNPKRLTRAKARLILAEGKAQGKKLTLKQRKFFGARASGYPAYPTPKRSRYSKLRINQPKGALIYGRVLKIFARKTTGPYKGQDFVHTFKKGAIMVGMPDGSLRITHP